MQICHSIEEMRKATAVYRRASEKIALVPTMGYLHAGHMALVKRARAEGDRVIVWIFVNPTQFENPDDLEKYPRDANADLALLREHGVDAVFLPTVDDIYPAGSETIVETTRLANMLHGAVRPGHFRGVTTVVCKFFNIIQPDLAVFGEKDYQQLQVIKRMVRDLHMPIQIIGQPTVRADDGLALSSRNVRLTGPDRAAAVILNQSLQRAADLAKSGTTVAALTQSIADTIASQPRATLVGCDIVADETLAPIAGPLTGPTAIMISVQIGGILLIDQKVVSP